MKHKDAGLRCFVAHLGSEGELLPACKKCSECGEWLRPDEFVNGQCLPTLRAGDKCPHCDGTTVVLGGFEGEPVDCPACKGTGICA